VLARSRLPDFDVIFGFGEVPLWCRPSGPLGVCGTRRETLYERVPAALFSLCTAEAFWDVPLPRLCDARCDGRFASASSHADGGAVADMVSSPLPVSVPVPSAAEGGNGAEEEAVLCYMFRLLTTYAELLDYVPAHGQIPSAAVGSHGAWQLPPSPAERDVDSFIEHCAALLEQSVH